MMDKLVGGAVMAYSAAWSAIAANDLIMKFTTAIWSWRHALEGWM